MVPSKLDRAYLPANVVFPNAGTYWIQTIANTVVLDEFPLIVTDTAGVEAMRPADEVSETVN